MRIEPIIAMLNDNQSLKQKKVLDLFVDLFSKKDPKEINKEIFEDYLRIQIISDNSRYSEISKELLDKVSGQNLERYEQYISRAHKQGINFIPFYRDEFPQRLWSISDPPLCLFVDGNLSALSNGVAVVGTRDAYEHRVDFVKKIAHKLVKMDKTVVSGLAHGVDAAAHKGALEAGGRTTAVLPGDAQTIRPSGNESLAKKIRNRGALVGELTDRKTIHKGRFVERNRLISGISSAVVIGASGETGGTIHQANFAKEQGKPRFLYEAKKDDGQSPNKLYNKGFVSFGTVEELEGLIQQKFEPANSASERPSTLDDFQ